MRKNLIKSYDDMKNKFIKKLKVNDSMKNIDRFFSGLKQFSEIGETKAYDFDFRKVAYSLRYAIMIFIVGLIVLLSFIPSIHKLYVDAKYKNLLYKELIHSYIDTFEVSYSEKKNEYNRYLINLKNDTFVTEMY